MSQRHCFRSGWSCLAVVLALSGCAPERLIVADRAERTNSVQLSVASAMAMQSSLERGGFLQLASQARYQIDRQVYPPVETGSNSPGVLIGALGAGIGAPLFEHLQNDPATFLAIVERLKAWEPKFDAGYDPGWKYAKAVPQADREAIVADVLQKMIAALEPRAKLYAHPEYARLVVARGELTKSDQSILKDPASLSDAEYQARRDQQQKNYALMTDVTLKLIQLKWEIDASTRWHARVGWKAEDYFEDRAVIDLCRAIEDDDVPRMRELIAAGVDVNTRGKDSMTLLLWAMPDRRLGRFECLLQHGADPWIEMESDFAAANEQLWPALDSRFSILYDRSCAPGQSVMRLACFASIEYLKLLLEHSADPNDPHGPEKEPLLNLVIDRHRHDARDRVELLLAHGADPNPDCRKGIRLPVERAMSEDHYSSAAALLEAGADPGACGPDHMKQFLAMVAKARDIQAASALHDPRLTYAGDRPEGLARIMQWAADHGHQLPAPVPKSRL